MQHLTEPLGNPVELKFFKNSSGSKHSQIDISHARSRTSSKVNEGIVKVQQKLEHFEATDGQTQVGRYLDWLLAYLSSSVIIRQKY